jgi:hypothetical protein
MPDFTCVVCGKRFDRGINNSCICPICNTIYSRSIIGVKIEKGPLTNWINENDLNREKWKTVQIGSSYPYL